MAIVQGWWLDAHRYPSENCDERPPGTDIDLVIIHSISLPPGEFGGPWIHALFTNALDPYIHPYFKGIAALRVSAHLLIRRTGEAFQYVPFHRRAWHAGVSSFEGRPKCNDYSIGIELEGCDDKAYTDEQYRRLQEILGILQIHYPKITPSRIVGHCHVAPGRKTDPGPLFQWERLNARSGMLP
ncbi:MAG: 1,6-anhydro-N-acetylmuramyl-L-alanine amidase AmpD [Gammaproteobacteria bacterium]|nr:MAG: 1,6-anhydro-N-acetylmuramyl-L-alanine amidase AmpD [Gammaproteobacteria bacterium]